MKQIMTLIFGERAQGTKLTNPTLRTLQASNRPSESEWAKEFKFGSRYGHRGSFYQTR
jgi:hypothetical protein